MSIVRARHVHTAEDQASDGEIEPAPFERQGPLGWIKRDAQYLLYIQ
jgi:hypothetical protein